MLHEKSLLSYLLAVVAMATVGCDDGTVNHDVFTKADGTLNLCGTFDTNGAIVDKGDVVKIVRVINSERYEYTCAQFDDSNSKCLGIERKICKNDNFDDACKDETLANDGLSKVENLYKAAFHNHACPIDFTCRSTIDGTNRYECTMAICNGSRTKLDDADNCGRCNNKCSDTGDACIDGKCISVNKCNPNELACRCTGSVANGDFKCSPIRDGEEVSKDERVCIDSTSDQMCGITKCEDFKGEEVCPIGRSCDTSRGTATCVCSEGTYEIEGGACASPYSREHCGINPVNPGFACTGEGQLCDGTKCICPPNFSNCTDSNDNTECTDLSHDRYNCGSCNNDCTTHDPNAICKNFECVCPDTHVKCNGKCIDPKTDANYCGAEASCTDDAMGMTCGTNQLCNDGKCKCNDGFVDVDLDDSTPPKCVAIDTQPHAEYSKYCGITDVNQSYQNCNKIEFAKCSAKDEQFICDCIDGYIPIYDTVDNAKKLIACIGNDIANNQNEVACEYKTKDDNTADYTNCYRACSENDRVDHCNPNYKDGSLWSCVDNRCVLGCGSHRSQCKKRAYNPKTGDYTDFDAFTCVDNKRLTEKRYTDEEQFLCECSTCPSTNENEVCLDLYDPSDKSTNPDATAINSLNHCSACYDSCSEKGLMRCAKPTPDSDSYTCLCAEDQHSVYYKDKLECLPDDIESYHFDCKSIDDKIICTCKDGYVDYDGNFQNGCELYAFNDTTRCSKGGTNTDVVNCNEHIEEYNVMFASCSNGSCSYSSCIAGYSECNGETSDGCENDLSSLDHCGKCANRCALGCNKFGNGCENFCVANPSTNEKSCCATGEFQSVHDVSEITCCDGYKLFHYQYRAGVPSCFYKSHYGCFESAPDNGNCWHEVDQLP